MYKEKENFIFLFTFEDSIDDIDFNENNIDSLIKFQISEASENSYFVEECYLNGDKLKLIVSFKTSFKKTLGKSIFLNTQIFKVTSK